MDISTLRSILPAFNDPVRYTDASIGFWLNTAIGKLDPARWGSSLDEGLLYFTAHSLIMAERANTAGGNGVGIVASKALGPGSISYDNTLGTLEDAGPFNLTPWGRRYWQLVLMVGMGGLQLNPGPYDISAPYGSLMPPGGIII